MPLQVAVTTLGENNIGPFGPQAADPARSMRIAEANANPERRLPASRRYICVDGRLSQDEIDAAAAGAERHEADPQLPGGQVITETAAYYMTQGDKDPLSQVVATTTRNAIADNFIPTVHGANGDTSKCKANEDLREVLIENAGNIDIVVPIAYAVISGLGIDHLVDTKQLTAMVVEGKDSADTEALWDASASEVVQIAVDNGAEYIDLIGDHLEGGIRADLSEGAVDRAKLIDDIALDEIIQQFIASLGQYKQDTFERFAAKGKSEAEAAQLVSKAALYTIGISKHLSTKDMPVFLVS